MLAAAQMVQGQRQGRVTDRGKEQSGAYPSVMFAGANRLASDGADINRDDDDVVRSRGRIGGSRGAPTTSEIAHRKRTPVFVKPAAR